MKKWLPVFILFLAILGGIWFWSLGALPEVEPSGAVLKEFAGDVTVKHPGEEAFRKASLETELENGAIVKTGAFSKAIIDFYGQAETELGEESELLIEQTELSEENQSPIIHLNLLSGRIWSRVVSILDLEGEFQAGTSDVVATVRGTSFDLAIDAGGTTLWVADSVVETHSDNISFVPENRMLRFQNGQRTGEMERLTDQAKKTEWFTRNSERDEGFYEEMQARLLKQVGGDRLSAPGIFRDITRGSETLRTSLSNESEREQLMTRYLLRRFAVIQNQMKADRLGSAQRAFSKLRQDLLKAKDGSPAQARAARKALMLGVRLFHPVDPTNEAYSLKQQIEELLIEMSPNENQAMMMRLMFVQSRLSEARKALLSNRLDASGQILELAKQSHGNVAREMELMDQGSDSMEKLRSVMHAIEVRMTHFEEALEEARQVVPVREIELFGEADETANSPEFTGPRCTDLHIRAIPPFIGIGETANISVQAVLENGEIIDVSKDALIVLTGDIAAISGTTVTGEKAGSGSVQVTYNCQGESIARQGAITVTSVVTVEGIIIRPSAIQIDTLQEIALKADLLYSNGQKKEVTQGAVFTNLTPQFGFIAENRFVAGQTEGVARVQVRYTENGQTYSAIANITIQELLP